MRRDPLVLVEHDLGEYLLDKWRTTYPDEIAKRGGWLNITLLGAHEFYDDGHTVHSEEGIKALGDFTAAVIERISNVDSIEIGNEFNGNNFLRGEPGRADYRRRTQPSCTPL
ncbi:MAG: hypothetical protein AAFO63_14140 [Pseudomonadota bacterium]